MKKLLALLLCAALVAAGVWYAVRTLPRVGSQTGAADTTSGQPRHIEPAPPLPGLGPSCGGHCGTERWAVKTLSDMDRDCVSLRPTDATVEQLAGLAPERPRPGGVRARPAECTVYRVEAFMAAWDTVMRRENDRDYHVVLFDRVNQRVSLIAEIPNPECADACRSGLAQKYAEARAALEEGVRRPNPRDLPIRVRVTGVGFFDRAHGQIGRAPNGFELHPVLSIEFLPLEP
jgi:hypothetical protein